MTRHEAAAWLLGKSLSATGVLCQDAGNVLGVQHLLDRRGRGVADEHVHRVLVPLAFHLKCEESGSIQGRDDPLEHTT